MEKAAIQRVNGHNIATFLHDAGSKKLVIFCHGYRGTSVGPSRFFTRAARKLADKGISSLRFDQYGSGNSEGEYIDSSFNDWIATTIELLRKYQDEGYEVSLFGQSMGASNAIVVGSEFDGLSSIVAWVPDAEDELIDRDDQEIVEEAGQIVRAIYWREAYEAKTADKLRSVKSPVLIYQASEDEYLNEKSRQLITDNAQSNHQVILLEGHTHSKWTYEQSEQIIDDSVNFIVNSFE